MAVRTRFIARERSRIDMVIDGHRPPDLEEQTIKRRLWVGAFRKLGRIRDNRFQRRKNIGVSARLRSR
jgi:hypothetical protein